jgi:hypothetical protein
MPHRLLFVLAGLGGAAAAVLLTAGPAHGQAPSPLLPAPIEAGGPGPTPPPPIPPVPLPALPPVPSVPGLPPVPPRPPIDVPVPPLPVLPVATPVLGAITNQVGAPLPGDRAHAPATRGSRAPHHRAAPRVHASARVSAATRAWRKRAMPSANAPQARAPMISSGPAPTDPQMAVLGDQSADGAASSPKPPVSAPFALRPSSAAIVDARPTPVVFSRAPPLRSGFLVGGGRPG